MLARISLATEPLPNRSAVIQTIKGCGSRVEELLKEIDAGGGSTAPPRRGKYCGAAAAFLVALLEATELAEATAAAAAKDAGVVPKETLLASAAEICEQRFVQATNCAAAQQLQSLATLQLVKEVQRKLCASGIAYHLTDAGRTRAMELRSGGEAKDAAPLHHHQRVKPNEKGAVILLVDEREGGSSRHHLRPLCDALERAGCRYETRVLPRGLGDYAFVRCDGPPYAHEKLLPRLIERKSAVDVAESLKDGRWEAQQAAMARTNAETFHGRATLEYIIEGEIDDAVHKQCAACAHVQLAGQRGVGGCHTRGYPTLDRVQAALRKLDADPSYTITRTHSMLATARYLAKEAKRLQNEHGQPQQQQRASPPPQQQQHRDPPRSPLSDWPQQRARRRRRQ